MNVVLMLLTTAATSAVVSSATAERGRWCHGATKDAYGEAEVSILFDPLEREVSRTADWTPAPAPATVNERPGEALLLLYSLSGDRLEEPDLARVLTSTSIDPGVRSKTAAVEIQVDGVTWRQPWTRFARLPRSVSSDADPHMRFFDVVGVASSGAHTEVLNLDLLPALEHGRDVRVIIRGDADEVLGESDFQLSDHAARDRLVGQALAKARNDPASCQPTPGG